MSKETNKIAIIDADLIGRKKHRFPNLACEKLSAYWKEKNAEVSLHLNFNNLDHFDEVYVSKVFTDTPIPSWLISYVDGEYFGAFYECNPPQWIKFKRKPIINIGGTGFYFDKAPELPYEIEHHMPDYNLYDEWICSDIEKAKAKYENSGRTFNETRYRMQYKEYLDYSIGFATRGCFRKCGFCVNKKFDHVFSHSPLEEFYDPSRRKICLLDDNFLGHPDWNIILQSILSKGKRFKFKQGLDERLLTEEKCKLFFDSSYDGDLTFAFDDISDYDLIHKKLKMIRKYNQTKGVIFYVLVGFESTDAVDIENAFKRIELLFKYRCLPYIMRYMSNNDTPWKNSPYRSFYITLARWCNQPSIVKKMTFREFCVANQALHKTEGTYCSSMKCMTAFEEEHPEIAKRYFDIRFGENNTKCLIYKSKI